MADPDILPARALFVDPDADTRTLYALFFETEGWTVLTAPTAAAALAAVATTAPPHVFVLDAVLPDMPAAAFCDALWRQTGMDGSTRLIVVTGWLRSPLERAALTASGVEHVLQKPCLPDALLATVRPRVERLRRR